jgi:hypothetical protein
MHPNTPFTYQIQQPVRYSPARSSVRQKLDVCFSFLLRVAGRLIRPARCFFPPEGFLFWISTYVGGWQPLFATAGSNS